MQAAVKLAELARDLSAQPVTLELLQSTGIGKAVKRLSKHKDPLLNTVSAAYRQLMSEFCVLRAGTSSGKDRQLKEKKLLPAWVQM